ncbi:MAG: 2,3,4,5-tetrahydropyridine-2,6-dicarboxylate N-acetyltransferase [Candidatus Aminicenantales bacterium]
MDYKKIAGIISTSRKKTPAKVYIRGNFSQKDFEDEEFKAFGQENFWILIGDYPLIEEWIKKRKKEIKDHYVDIAARFSALPLLDLSKVDARVEPGALIREGARIDKGCVVMMGAVINIGAEIGARTMVDMNAVVGARALIGRECHIGAGAVIAGVLEPPSEKRVIIEDRVLVGANAVVLEGVKVGQRSVVAAGAVVLEDVKPGVVVAGVPAKVIGKAAEISEKEKISILKSLRRHR